jgi:hypothetical protein
MGDTGDNESGDVGYVDLRGDAVWYFGLNWGLSKVSP